MRYFITKFSLCARLLITIHDEIRFLVKDEDVVSVALALQLSNLWTRALFAHSVGMDDLPLVLSLKSFN